MPPSRLANRLFRGGTQPTRAPMPSPTPTSRRCALCGKPRTTAYGSARFRAEMTPRPYAMHYPVLLTGHSLHEVRLDRLLGFNALFAASLHCAIQRTDGQACQSTSEQAAPPTRGVLRPYQWLLSCGRYRLRCLWEKHRWPQCLSADSMTSE